MSWYALHVTTGKEYEIRSKLKSIDNNAEIYVPRKNYREVNRGVVKNKSERMLPGYILVNREKTLNALILGNFFQLVGMVTDQEIAHF